MNSTSPAIHEQCSGALNRIQKVTVVLNKILVLVSTA